MAFIYSLLRINLKNSSFDLGLSHCTDLLLPVLESCPPAKGGDECRPGDSCLLPAEGTCDVCSSGHSAPPEGVPTSLSPNRSEGCTSHVFKKDKSLLVHCEVQMFLMLKIFWSANVSLKTYIARVTAQKFSSTRNGKGTKLRKQIKKEKKPECQTEVKNETTTTHTLLNTCRYSTVLSYDNLVTCLNNKGKNVKNNVNLWFVNRSLFQHTGTLLQKVNGKRKIRYVYARAA